MNQYQENIKNYKDVLIIYRKVGQNFIWQYWFLFYYTDKHPYLNKFKWTVLDMNR